MDLELLKDLCRIPGAPGFESGIRNYILKLVKSLTDELSVDALGNIIAVKKGSGKSKLLFSAHMDEIGFIVQHIDDEGFIRFLPLGGFDPKTLSAQRVIIHGREDVLGVMGTKPIHLMTPEERNKAPLIRDYFIDTGLSKDEVLKKINVGDPITRERDLIKMGKCINAKSLDNRISVYVLIECLRRLKKQKHEADVYFVFTVQEEVGLRGAKTIVAQIQPEYSINIDTTIAFDVPGSQAHEVVTRLGQGVGIKIMDSMAICDYRMTQFLKQTADKSKIKWQAELLPAGGTDTAAIQTGGKGCISGALSIPTRHIHQVIEMVNEDDVEAGIQLCIKSIQSIQKYDWKH
ncbi:MAG: M42 family metallopeptidase [Saprospiraceae bacterium]|nr:M42 family metallopeptidase [Saprospiraceae bacterium]